MKIDDQSTRAWWVHCDIDGAGRKWRLMVERTDGVYFPVEDFGEEMTMDEYRETFPDNTVVPCQPPSQPPHLTDGTCWCEPEVEHYEHGDVVIHRHDEDAS
jgi:hypothetical protein